MINYFIYCRKSSEARDRQVLSIEAQKRELLEYAERNKLKVIEIFEESQSAYKLGRPIFERMMKLCEEGIANGILTWKADRLARNALDGGKVIQALDDKVLLEIRTPYEIFRQEDNRMMLYLLFGMSNDYSRQISSNVKRGYRQKYARGEFLGRTPVGYVYAKVGDSRNIVPDPAKAPIIRKAFEEYSSGKYSVMDVLKEVQKLGLTSVSGRTFVKSEIYRLLRCPVYYGVYQHGGEFHNGSYEPIISKTLFDQVQDVLDNKSKPKTKDWVHIYKGLIKCSNCGCAITATTKTKHYHRTNRTAEYTYYGCTKRKEPCDQQWITEEELDSMFTKEVSKITIDREFWELGVKLLKAKHASEFETHNKIKFQLEIELNKIDKALEKLLALRLSEEITAEEYAEQKKIFIDRKLLLKEKVNDRESSTANWLELAEKFFETAFHAREVMESDNLEAKRELVRTVGWNLFLKDKKLQFSFRKPYDVLLQPKMRTDVRD